MTDAAPGVAATDGLEALGPSASRIRKVRVGDREITIEPMRMRQIRHFAPHAKPLVEWFNKRIAGRKLREAFVDVDAILQLASQHGEGLNRCVGIATGLSFDEVEDLTPDTWLELCLATWACNLDFFGRRLLPTIREMTEAEGVTDEDSNQLPDGTGPTP